jgi:hypothetical protein
MATAAARLESNKTLVGKGKTDLPLAGLLMGGFASTKSVDLIS